MNAPGGSNRSIPRRQSAVFGPLGADNPVNLIDQRIRAAIGAGILEDGTLLPSEREMAEVFGVGLFSVREALARLREDGLIVTRRGRYGGSTVLRGTDQAREILNGRLRAMSTAELRDAADWLLMLTTEEARLAAGRGSARNVTRLMSLVQRFGELSTVAAATSAIGRVHMELAAAAQSTRMSAAELDFHAQNGWLIAAGLEDEDCRRGTFDDLATMVRAIEGRNDRRAQSSAEIYATRLSHSISERRQQAVRRA